VEGEGRERFLLTRGRRSRKCEDRDNKTAEKYNLSPSLGQGNLAEPVKQLLGQR